MATAVLRSHDALNNQMHLNAFTPSPTKPRRRRSPKPAGASSPPPRALAVTSPAPKAASVASPAPKPAAVASPPVKAAAPSRRSPPRPAARKQPSPTKEKPKQRLVMEEIRILKRGEEPPAPAPAPAPAPVLAAPVAKVAAVDQHVLCSATRIGPQEPPVVPVKIMAPSAAAAPCYAGPAFSASAPEPSSLPFPAFIRRAETEATRGLRCLLRIGELA